MKRTKLLVASLILLLGGSTYAQTTVVTATVLDSDGTAWVNGSWSIVFRPNPSYSNTGQYKIAGADLDPAITTQSGSIDNTGALSMVVYRNSQITPAGSSWSLTVCPQASSACGVYIFSTSSSTLDISSNLTATIPPPQFKAIAGAYGYNNNEATVQLVPGSTYFDVTDQAQKYYYNGTWQAAAIAVTGTGDSRSGGGLAVNMQTLRTRLGNVCADDYLWMDTVYGGTDIGYAMNQAIAFMNATKDPAGRYMGTLSICKPANYTSHTTIDWPIGLSGRGNGSQVYCGADFKNYGVCFHHGSQPLSTAPSIDSTIENFKFFGHQLACHYSLIPDPWCGYDSTDHSIGVAQGGDPSNTWRRVVQGVDQAAPAEWATDVDPAGRFIGPTTAGFETGRALGAGVYEYTNFDWQYFKNTNQYVLNYCPIGIAGELPSEVGGKMWGAWHHDVVLNCKGFSANFSKMAFDYPNNAGFFGSTENASIIGASPGFTCTDCWFERNSGAVVNATVNVSGGSANISIHNSKFVEQSPAGGTFAVTNCDTTTTPGYVKLTGTWSSANFYDGTLLSSGGGVSLTFNSFASNCTGLNNQTLHAGTPGNNSGLGPVAPITATTFIGQWGGAALNGADTGVGVVPAQSAYVIVNQPSNMGGPPDTVDLSGNYSFNGTLGTYSITSVTADSPVAGKATYCGSFSPVGANNGLVNANWSIFISGLTNTTNNGGPVNIQTSTNTCFTISNASAITEVGSAGSLSGAASGRMGNQVKRWINTDNDVTASWCARALWSTGSGNISTGASLLGPKLFTDYCSSTGLLSLMGGVGRSMYLNNYFMTGPTNLNPVTEIVPPIIGPQAGLGYTVDTSPNAVIHAINVGTNVENSTITSVTHNSPIVGQATYTGTISNGDKDLSGYDLYIPQASDGGFSNNTNNTIVGPFPIISNTATTIVVSNVNAVDETKTVTVQRILPLINICKGSTASNCYFMQMVLPGVWDTSMDWRGYGYSSKPVTFATLKFPCTSGFDGTVQRITDSPSAVYGTLVTVGGGSSVTDIKCDAATSSFYVGGRLSLPYGPTGYSQGTCTAAATVTIGGFGGATANCAQTLTASKSGYMVPALGTVSNLAVRCNTTGIDATDGVFTLYKTPAGSTVQSATTITLTYGNTVAGTVVSDNTHTVNVNAGDVLILAVQSEAGTTTGGCSASLQGLR